jgi:two-component sensor histidine kinase/PAS domain-containing protein
MVTDLLQGQFGFGATRETILALAYLLILAAIIYLLRRRRYMAASARVLAVLALIFAAGSLAVHTIIAAEFGPNVPELQEVLQLLADGTVLIAALLVWPAVHLISRQPSSAQLKEEIANQMRKLDELRAVRSELEGEVAARTDQLQETVQRFDIVLRQSPVSVFSQSADLRYTWIRNPPPGYPHDWLGKTDVDLLAPEAAARMTEIKNRVMKSGDARRTEIVLTADEEPHWYDLTVEPLRAVDGNIVGITSAAVDITHRKQSEQLLEMLLREVTHRSKNLLAICQAIVRHTAPRTTAGQAYSAQLGGRLQALAVSHDLLVEENWHGVALSKLVWAQFGQHAERIGRQVEIEGPEIMLRPNGVDSLGLVVHELIENAVRYGALSVAAGKVSVRWRMIGSGDEKQLQLMWQESGGPPVRAPAESGFGRVLLEDALGESLRGEVKLEFPPDGVRCEIRLPELHVARSDVHSERPHATLGRAS